MKTLKQQILDIVTYHSQGGTSGYLLSDRQVEKIIETILDELQKECDRTENEGGRILLESYKKIYEKNK